MANKEAASTEPDKFPLRNQHDGRKEQDEVNYLRKTKNYLGFGRGLFSLETWQTMGTILAGFLLMMTIPSAILLGIVLGLWWGPQLEWWPAPEYIKYQNILMVAAIIGAIGLEIMLIRLRQVSAFFEWVFIHSRPLLLLAVAIGLFAASSESAELFFWSGLLIVVLLWDIIKRIYQMWQSGYYSYKLRRRHDKRMGWRLAMLSGVITAILLGGFIYKYAHDLTLRQTEMSLVLMFVSIGSILVIMAGRFLNLFQKAQEKLTGIVVSIALVILFSALFSLLLAGSSEIERRYQADVIYDLALEVGIDPLQLEKLKQPEKLNEFKEELNKPDQDDAFAKAWKKLFDTQEGQIIPPSVNGNKFKLEFNGAQTQITIWAGIVIGILLIMGFFTNLNYNSLHYFYRTRLSNTYLRRGEKEEEDDESLLLTKLHNHCNGPYHLINTTLNVPSSTEPSLSGRGADFFIFSKYYCGAESTGYRRTDCYRGGYTKLATAMAISGAAASPEMGSSTNPGMAALMTLLNIRLNLWMANPKLKPEPKIILWPQYLLKELLRKSTENDTLLNLSDGGHHENLGIYPLLKRRCKLIIASDAGADPGYKMEDFANLQRKARIDLGINIEINMADLYPDEKTRYTNAYFVKGIIHYPGGEKGTLFYIKTTMTGNEPEDLLAYQRKNPNFPDETTADQFFNEDQFESYRKLGEWIGERFYFETVVKDKMIETDFDIFAIDAQNLKPIVESLKIADLENVIVNMEKPVTFYPQREEESGLGEPFCNLVQKFVNEDREQLVETIREWLKRKNHQHLLWFAGEMTGYFKLSELREDLRPFCQSLMDEPNKDWSDWELSCFWAYARFNDYEQIHKMLQTTTNATTQKWMLTVYTQMVAIHPEEGKHQRFIDEVKQFLQRSGIQDDVKTEAQKVLEELENSLTTVAETS